MKNGVSPGQASLPGENRNCIRDTITKMEPNRFREKRMFIGMRMAVTLAAVALSGIALTGCTSLVEAANEGDTAAQWQLADKMMTGKDGYPCNPGEAKKWLEKSISGENMDALAVKGEFMLDGRYGKVTQTDILDTLYPATRQNKNGRAGAVYLRACIKNNDVAHMAQCAEAIDAVFNGPKQYRCDTSLLLYKSLRPWIKQALDVKGKRLAVQKNQIEGTNSFLSVGWSLTHDQRKELEDWECDRVSRQMSVLKGQMGPYLDLLARTREVVGKGLTAKECQDDAKRLALNELCGIKVTGQESVSVSESTVNGQTDQKEKVGADILSQYEGKLESFLPVEGPTKQADGTYVGTFLAVAKENK